MMRFAARFDSFFQRWLPSALSIAVLLTLVVFALALALTDAGPMDCIDAWGDGFWGLVKFTLHMTVIVFSGHMVAESPIVSRGLRVLAGVPRSPRQAVAFVALISLVLGYLHWGISLVACALLIRSVARRVEGVHYPLLVLAGYLGVACIFHAGLSASAPLMVATEGNEVKDWLSVGTVPVSTTLFSTFNIALAIVVVVLLVGIMTLLHPKPENVKPFAPEEDDDRLKPVGPRKTPADMLDKTPVLNLVIGGFGAVYLIHGFGWRDFSLGLGTVNLIFMSLAFMLHPSPDSLGAAAVRAIRTTHGIVLQFPLYAGIMGVIKGTGLSTVIADALANVSSPESFPVVVYGYSGVLNYFVPSGGSKFVAEAPYILEAAQALGVPEWKTIVAYSWGDMSTNIIQPFWAIPLLSVAGLKFRDIMAYALTVFMIYFPLCALAIYLFL